MASFSVFVLRFVDITSPSYHFDTNCKRVHHKLRAFYEYQHKDIMCWFQIYIYIHITLNKSHECAILLPLTAVRTCMGRVLVLYRERINDPYLHEKLSRER
jgi:hypothetical protein